MKLTLLGGGGFRVPLLFRTLLTDRSDHRVTQLRLWDTDHGRIQTVSRILHAMAEDHPEAPVVIVSDSLTEAIRDTDFVFSAIRVGGTRGRATEEEIAHCCGVLGQETTGFGGLDYALRGIPTAVEIARTVADTAPEAHLINFTNPAGIITEVSSHILGDRLSQVLPRNSSTNHFCYRIVTQRSMYSLSMWVLSPTFGEHQDHASKTQSEQDPD